jgi:hypothetical protein
MQGAARGEAPPPSTHTQHPCPHAHPLPQVLSATDVKGVGRAPGDRVVVPKVRPCTAPNKGRACRTARVGWHFPSRPTLHQCRLITPRFAPAPTFKSQPSARAPLPPPAAPARAAAPRRGPHAAAGGPGCGAAGGAGPEGRAARPALHLLAQQLQQRQVGRLQGLCGLGGHSWPKPSRTERGPAAARQALLRGPLPVRSTSSKLEKYAHTRPPWQDVHFGGHLRAAQKLLHASRGCARGGACHGRRIAHGRAARGPGAVDQGRTCVSGMGVCLCIRTEAACGSHRLLHADSRAHFGPRKLQAKRSASTAQLELPGPRSVKSATPRPTPRRAASAPHLALAAPRRQGQVPQLPSVQQQQLEACYGYYDAHARPSRQDGIFRSTPAAPANTDQVGASCTASGLGVARLGVGRGLCRRCGAATQLAARAGLPGKPGEGRVCVWSAQVSVETQCSCWGAVVSIEGEAFQVQSPLVLPLLLPDCCMCDRAAGLQTC